MSVARAPNRLQAIHSCCKSIKADCFKSEVRLRIYESLCPEAFPPFHRDRNKPQEVIVMRDLHWNRNDPKIKKPFHLTAQTKPFRFSLIKALIRTCKCIHDEISDFLYSRHTFQIRSDYDPDHPPSTPTTMEAQCYLIFDYDPIDRPAILRCNMFARFLYGIRLRNASHLGKLVLTFKPGLFRQAEAEESKQLIQTLSNSLEMIKLFLNHLHELELVFENDNGEQYPDADGETAFDIDGLPTVEIFVLRTLEQYEEVLCKLHYFSIVGMKKDPFVWARLEKMEIGVTRQT